MEPKQAAAETDRLSTLPVMLRDEILVRLDLRDAVRTSVLSHAWRDLWKSLSVISLSFPHGTHPSVVDSVVLPYIGPRVSLFDIFVNDASAGRIDDWLVALSHCSVESIRIRFRFRPCGRFKSDNHSSIFFFSNLVSLRLECCEIPPLPVGFVGFLALQELVLNFVVFPDNGDRQFEAIIRRSPLLHTLDMYDVCIPDEYPVSVIEAPNLRILSIYSKHDYGWRFGELPCLEYADIQVFVYEHGFEDFLAPFAHVQKLSLYLAVEVVEISYTLPFTFSNLKLCTDFSAMYPILFLFTLLRSCHNLENLEMEFDETVDQSFEGNWELLNSQWSDDMCANLQTVRMIDPYWFPNQISFMKLFLSEARLLRTLYVDRSPRSVDPLIDLLNCRRSSTQARVVLKVRCSSIR